MIAEVIVDIANAEVDRIFDYVARLDTKVGQRVKVPFGSRYIEGYVINLKDSSEVPAEKLKEVGQSVDDYPVLLPELLDLCKDMCKRNHLRNVDCMRLFVPSQLRSKSIKPLIINYLKVCEDYNPDKYLENIRANAKKQKDMLLYLEANLEYPQAELNKMFGAINVSKLINSNVLLPFTKQKIRSPFCEEKNDKQVKLSAKQKSVVQDILLQPEMTHLLFGVTGSGKTEVYMNVIDKVLQQGKNAILLVPEISLTPQVMGVFKARFGDEVALLHSGLSDGERFDEWQRIRLGDARIIIGARSAIFAPVSNLGAIIMDEEHDPSYKSESNPRFLTHDVAQFRAKYNHCPLILGSATPSLESYNLAKQGAYILHELPERANKKEMPVIQVIDMCNEVRNGNTGMFSGQLLEDLENCVKNNNQAMLFINRRGFSSYMICRECGYVAKCEDCDVSLVYHKEDNQLKCHYCNRRYKALDCCPKCHSQYIRMGAIGTQKVVEELQKLFPKVKILRLDFDTTKNKNSLTNILSEFGKTKPSILVGTQMIAKGHDFPDVTLVGVMNADMSLHFSDFRSVERTYQLVTQVAGRAGRADKTGKVILQTYTPKHYVYRFVANYNYPAFFEKEINLRQVSNFPPFAKIVRVLITGENDTLAHDMTGKIFDELKTVHKDYLKDFIYFSAMKSPITRIQNKHRYQILLRFTLEKEQEILDKIYQIVSNNTNPKLQIFVETNPANLS